MYFTEKTAQRPVSQRNKPRNFTEKCDFCRFIGQAFPIETTIEETYLSATKQFGHERVLYSMLLEKYPWRAHKTFAF